MNHAEQNHHHTLQRFEELNRGESRVSPIQFIETLSSTPSHALQLEIIGVDIELYLARGANPSYQNYIRSFPWLEDQIPDLYTDVVETFVEKFCPVKHSLGTNRETTDYEIGREIGRGGMGVAYEAVQKSLDRPVAMKVLFLSRESIFEEAKKAALLAHRNVCRIYDAGKIGNFPFMTMQRVRGNSLKYLLDSSRPDIADGLSIVVQVAGALAAAHHENLVHLDVKPGNVIVNPRGEAWLMDFGLSRQRSEITDESGRLQPVSPQFCAPEQLDMQYGERGFRSDIYSLGLVLYKVLCGRGAYMGDFEQIADQIKHDPPRRLVDYDARIPQELDEICRKAIAKRPEDRFASMEEFKTALVECALEAGLLTYESVGFSLA